jgi:hypothetical protein
MSQGEAFSRVKIDAQLYDVGWNVTDGRSVRYEYPLDDRTRADYVLCDRKAASSPWLKSLKVPIPPMPEQRAFAERDADIRATVDQSDRATVAAEQLQAALMARLFDGG